MKRITDNKHKINQVIKRSEKSEQDLLVYKADKLVKNIEKLVQKRKFLKAYQLLEQAFVYYHRLGTHYGAKRLRKELLVLRSILRKELPQLNFGVTKGPIQPVDNEQYKKAKEEFLKEFMKHKEGRRDDDNLPYPYIYYPPKPPDDIAPAAQLVGITSKDDDKKKYACQKCGYVLKEGEKHCPICGNDSL